MRLILKERKIGKLHEASVQRSCQGSLQSTYSLFGKFLKSPLQRAIPTRILRQRVFQFHKSG